MMNQIAFVILFLYIRSFDLPKYPKDLNDGRESNPDEQEFNIDKFQNKQQQQIIENLRQMEANYFLERRTF